jgi:uncharacterized protein (TIGR02145 family)
MKKNQMLQLALIAFILIAITACEKQDITVSENKLESKIVTTGNNSEPATINGVKYVFESKMDAFKLKGVYADHTNGAPWLRIKQGIVKVENSSKTYIAMQILRSTDPGDYFYIMCENLDIPGTNSNKYIAYDHSDENAEKYGLLYDWDEANNLSSTVYMDLPMVYNGVEYTQYTSRCYARLPNRNDIEYLLGSTIGNLPSNGTSPSADPAKMYYDAFVGGLGAENEAYDITLVGYANNMDYSPQRFFGMQKYTKLWTADLTPAGNAAYPLSIDRVSNSGTIYNYVAFINAGHAKRYGMVVRYVFEPSVN